MSQIGSGNASQRDLKHDVPHRPQGLLQSRVVGGVRSRIAVHDPLHAGARELLVS